MRAEDWDWGSKCVYLKISGSSYCSNLGEVLHNLSMLTGMHVISSSMVCSVSDHCVCGIYITFFSNTGASLIFFLHISIIFVPPCYSSHYLEGDRDREAKQLSIVLYNTQLSNIFFWSHIQTNTHQAVSIFLCKRKKFRLRSDEKRSLQRDRLSKMQQDMGVCSLLLISRGICTAQHSTHRLVWQLLHLHAIIQSSWEDTKARNLPLFS